MARKESDYEGWVFRLIEKAEDITHSYSMLDWLKFAANKIQSQYNVGITVKQIEVLSEYRNLVFDIPQEVGISIEQKTRYRDAQGHWATSGRAETRIVYKDSGHRYMKSSTANEKVVNYLGNTGRRKGKTNG